MTKERGDGGGYFNRQSNLNHQNQINHVSCSVDLSASGMRRWRHVTKERGDGLACAKLGWIFANYYYQE